MKQQIKVINGTTYKVTTMDAISALSVQSNLMKILGSAFGELSDGANKDSIKNAIKKLTENIDDEKVVSLILKLFERNVFYVKNVDNNKIDVAIDFETYFSGKITEMWQVTFFILEVNFGDVLGKLGLSSIFQEANKSLDS